MSNEIRRYDTFIARLGRLVGVSVIICLVCFLGFAFVLPRTTGNVWWITRFVFAVPGAVALSLVVVVPFLMLAVWLQKRQHQRAGK